MKIVPHLDPASVARLNATPEQLQKGLEAGMKRAGEITLQAKLTKVNRTYRRAIPTTKKGKPKWKRSGDFLRNQRLKRVSAEEFHVLTEGSAEKYEGRMADLPDGIDGINRTNAAAADAYETVKPQIAPVVLQEIKNAIR